VAVPHDATPARIPPSADIVGIGVVAMSLLLGRRLKDDEFLVSLGDLCETLTETNSGRTQQLSAAFRNWLAHALQFDPQNAYATTQEAQVAFEEVLAREKSYVTSPAQLDRFITAFERIAGEPRKPSLPPPNTPLSAALPDEPLPEPVTTPAYSGDVVASTAAGTAHPPVAAAKTTPTSSEYAGLTGTDAPSALAPTKAPGVSTVSIPVPAEETEDLRSDLAAAPAGRVAVPGWRRWLTPALGVIALAEALAIGWLMASGDSTPTNRGELVIQSRPLAARVSIDGEERGITPFQTEVAPGAHVVEVRVGRSEPRVIPVNIRAGVQTGLYVELQSVATVGGLEVRSEPGKARVSVGGQFRGETPLVLKDLPPGEVEVLVQAGGRQVKQTVRIEPGITSQLVVPLAR
jgi:hypothetical protein